MSTGGFVDCLLQRGAAKGRHAIIPPSPTPSTAFLKTDLTGREGGSSLTNSWEPASSLILAPRPPFPPSEQPLQLAILTPKGPPAQASLATGTGVRGGRGVRAGRPPHPHPPPTAGPTAVVKDRRDLSKTDQKNKQRQQFVTTDFIILSPVPGPETAIFLNNPLLINKSRYFCLKGLRFENDGVDGQKASPPPIGPSPPDGARGADKPPVPRRTPRGRPARGPRHPPPPGGPTHRAHPGEGQTCMGRCPNTRGG